MEIPRRVEMQQIQRLFKHRQTTAYCHTCAPLHGRGSPLTLSNVTDLLTFGPEYYCIPKIYVVLDQPFYGSLFVIFLILVSMGMWGVHWTNVGHVLSMGRPKAGRPASKVN